MSMGPKIKRWFKKRLWKGIFESVLEASPRTNCVALEIDEWPILRFCKQGEANFEIPPTLNYPLTVEGKEVGRLMVWSEVPEQEDSYWNAIVLLLQQWITTEHERRALAKEAIDRYREMAFLNHIAFALNSSLDIKKVASTLIEECRRAVPEAKYGAVLLFKKDGERFQCLAYFGDHTESLVEKVAETQLFRKILTSGKAEIVNEVGSDVRWNAFVPEIISFLGAPLISSERLLGGIFLAGTSPFTSVHLKSVSTIAAFGATAVANALHFLEIQKMVEAVMVSLATAVDSRDPCTAGHSRRTAQYAWALAEAVNKDTEYFGDFCFNSEQMREIYYAALLHDIGKIGVREHVLYKHTKLPEKHLQMIRLRLHFLKKISGLCSELPDPEQIFTRLQKINSTAFLSPEDREFILRLSKISISIGNEKIPLLDEEETEALLIPRGNLLPHEWEEIKRHPAESDRILKQIPFPENMANLRTIVRQHHEKLDGSGYPDGKKGEEILLQSRILTVCDIYDALTAADRPYKKAFPVEKAVAILREEASSGKLDPRLVEIFVKKVIGWKD